MKRLVNIIQILLIAIWPLAFLLMIGPVERSVRRLVTSTADPKYYIILAIIYIISGLIFALTGFRNRADNTRKSIVISHIVGGFLVVLFCVIWLLVMTGVIWSEFIAYICSSTPINFMSLVFGYTLYSTIKAVAILKVSIIGMRRIAPQKP